MINIWGALSLRAAGSLSGVDGPYWFSLDRLGLSHDRTNGNSVAGCGAIIRILVSDSRGEVAMSVGDDRAAGVFCYRHQRRRIEKGHRLTGVKLVTCGVSAADDAPVLMVVEMSEMAVLGCDVSAEKTTRSSRYSLSYFLGPRGC